MQTSWFLRLPQRSATTCEEARCLSPQCCDPSHQLARFRVAYVWSGCVHCELDFSSLSSEPAECTGVTLRFGHTETTVVSVYVSPSRKWDPAELNTSSSSAATPTPTTPLLEQPKRHETRPTGRRAAGSHRPRPPQHRGTHVRAKRSTRTCI